jgi:hypothetical protein
MRFIVRNVLAASGLTLAAFAAPASAQVATYENPTHVFVGALQFTGDQTTDENDVIYTVPSKRGFRVTDLIAGNWGIGSCLVFFPGKTNPMIIPVDETLSFNFLSGPTYGAGDEVRIANDFRFSGHGTSCNLTYTVMGYLYKRAQ